MTSEVSTTKSMYIVLTCVLGLIFRSWWIESPYCSDFWALHFIFSLSQLKSRLVASHCIFKMRWECFNLLDRNNQFSKMTLQKTTKRELMSFDKVVIASNAAPFLSDTCTLAMTLSAPYFPILSRPPSLYKISHSIIFSIPFSPMMQQPSICRWKMVVIIFSKAFSYWRVDADFVSPVTHSQVHNWA